MGAVGVSGLVVYWWLKGWFLGGFCSFLLITSDQHNMGLHNLPNDSFPLNELGFTRCCFKGGNHPQKHPTGRFGLTTTEIPPRSPGFSRRLSLRNQQCGQVALKPLGGSLVIFTPFCSTCTGKLLAGIDVSHKRKPQCVLLCLLLECVCVCVSTQRDKHSLHGY